MWSQPAHYYATFAHKVRPRLMWIGCGDDVGSQCQQGCQKATSCGGGGDLLCSSQCTVTLSRWRPEVRDAYFHCYLDGRTMNCANDAEACLAPAGQAAQPRAIDTSFRDACLNRRTACMSSFADDYCSQSVLFDSSVVDQASSCLQKPCDQIAACLRSAFGG